MISSNIKDITKKDKCKSVCIVAPAMPPIIGGAETFAEVLVLALIKANMRVFVVTANEPRKEVISMVEKSNGKVFILGDTFGAVDGYVAWEWAVFSRSKVIHEIITKYDIDVIHALSHDTIISARIALEDMKYNGKIPLVVTTSEMSTEDSEFGKARSKFVYNQKIDGLLQLSQYYYDLAIGYGCKPKQAKIAAVVDTDLFLSGNRDEGRKKLKLSKDKFLITCPSRFSRRKGQVDLLNALSNLPESIKCNIVCLLAGGTNSASEEYFQEILQLSKNAGIQCIVKSVLRSEMPDILAITDLVVMPSYKEGLGFAAIESMVVGCPVLLSRVSGFNEIPNGEKQVAFFEAGNIDDLSEKIKELVINEELRNEFRVNGKRCVIERFSVNQFSQQVTSLYQELLEIN